jgi:hypothetical protein
MNGHATFSREYTTASSYAPWISILSELCVRKVTKTTRTKMWSICDPCLYVFREVHGR